MAHPRTELLQNGGGEVVPTALVDRTNETLPALIDRATQRLRGARTSAEVFEARQLADLALHHARLVGAANETCADCLRIIVEAAWSRKSTLPRSAVSLPSTAATGASPEGRGSALLNGGQCMMRARRL